MKKKIWDYAELSKLAKTVGGPEKLVDGLVNNGIKTGRSEMLPVVGAGVVFGVVGDRIYQKLKDYFADKKTPEEIEVARKEIISGIEDYDASQKPEDETAEGETDNLGEEEGEDHEDI